MGIFHSQYRFWYFMLLSRKATRVIFTVFAYVTTCEPDISSAVSEGNMP